MAHAGIVHNRLQGWGEGNLHAVKEKSCQRKFRVEKSEGTPYRTHSYLPAAPSELGGEEAGLSPRVPQAEGEEHAVGLSWPWYLRTGRVGVFEVKRIR